MSEPRTPTSKRRLVVSVPAGTVVLINGSPLTLLHDTMMSGDEALFEHADQEPAKAGRES